MKLLEKTNLRKNHKIGLHPKAIEANAFANLFASALERHRYTTTESPVSAADLKAIDILIYHWPWFLERGVSFRRGLLGMRHIMMARRRSNLKLVWVAHNAQPHEGGNRLLAWLFFSQLDGVIYLSNHSRKIVRGTHKLSKNVKELVTVHGAYTSPRKHADLPQMPSSGPHLFSFGLIRPYKGFDQLLTAARNASERCTIGIAGRIVDESYAKALSELAHGMGMVSLDFRENFLPAAELDSMIDACHGVVMPYREILNSGAALHALSRARPVLVPNRGSMLELQDIIGSEWVHLFDGDLTSKVLDEFTSFVQTFPSDARPDLSMFSWERVSHDLAVFFDDLTEARP